MAKKPSNSQICSFSSFVDCISCFSHTWSNPLLPVQPLNYSREGFLFWSECPPKALLVDQCVPVVNQSIPKCPCGQLDWFERSGQPACYKILLFTEVPLWSIKLTFWLKKVPQMPFLWHLRTKINPKPTQRGSVAAPSHTFPVEASQAGPASDLWKPQLRANEESQLWVTAPKTKWEGVIQIEAKSALGSETLWRWRSSVHLIIDRPLLPFQSIHSPIPIIQFCQPEISLFRKP